ncbi:hypothetical protein D1872_263820 [compost metagenome]
MGDINGLPFPYPPSLQYCMEHLRVRDIRHPSYPFPQNSMTHLELAENHSRMIQLVQASDTGKINDYQVEHCCWSIHKMIEYREVLYLPSLAVDNHNKVLSAIQDKGIQIPEHRMVSHVSRAHILQARPLQVRK